MAAEVRRAIPSTINFRQVKRLSRFSNNRRKPLYQAVFSTSDSGRRAKAAAWHCIKDGSFIDPLYNTGNDFIYNDDFSENTDGFLSRDGQYDADSNRMVKNFDSNGRFHTNWLNLIYPRLRIARDLLRDEGVIFISIDDNEVAQLRKICDEIYGESNFICQFIWKSKLGKVGTTTTIAKTHEYIICYTKRIADVNFKMIENPNNGRKENLRQWGQADGREDRPSMWYPIVIDGIEVYPKKEDGTDGRWRVGQIMANELLVKNQLELVKKGSHYDIYRLFDAGVSISPYDTLLLDEIGTTAKGATSLNSLGLNKVFDYSKPVSLVRFFAELCTSENDLILDFFSGSATTAHAVMQLNAEDGGNRKFIMVQLPEVTDEKSEAFKAGYKNICEIGKERIRRAGVKIKADTPLTTGDLDVGFRVLKLDSSNMKDVYYTPDEYAQMNFNFHGFADNIKEDRSDEDLLFQVMLDLGIPLSVKIRREGDIYYVKDNYLIACFKCVDTPQITEIAKQKPHYAVFRDSSFASDSAMVNFEQVFATYSPNSIRRVL
jgi:adenine-specific DNA-methyltransferase